VITWGNGINLEAYEIRKQVQHFIDLRRYEKAKAIASDLISKYPDFAFAYYDMALCEYYLGRIDNAIELCQKSLELGMAPLTVYTAMMLYHNHKGDYKSVEFYYNNINKMGAIKADVRTMYGYSLWKRGRKKEGRNMIEEAFSEDSTNPAILYYILCTAKRGGKDKKRLRELINIYMNTGASEKDILMFAGRVEAHLGNWREAKKNFEKVLSIDPADLKADAFLAWTDMNKHLVKFGVYMFLAAAIAFFGYEEKIFKFLSVFLIFLYFMIVIIICKYRRDMF